MEFRSVINASCAVVYLEGRLAFSSYPEFRAATLPILEHPEVDEIHLNMAAVTFLDSSALGMILHFNQKVGEARKGLAIARPSPAIATILKVVNFEKLIKILP